MTQRRNLLSLTLYRAGSLTLATRVCGLKGTKSCYQQNESLSSVLLSRSFCKLM